MPNISVKAKYNISAVLVGLESRYRPISTYLLLQMRGMNPAIYFDIHLQYSISVQFEKVSQFEDWCSGCVGGFHVLYVTN